MADRDDSLSSYQASIETLDLSVRAYNCLKRANINTVGVLLALTRQQLLSVRNFGMSCYVEARRQLIERGYMSEEEPIGPFIDEP